MTNRFDHDEARRLREQGLGWKQIANQLGVTPVSIRRVCNPELAERMRSTISWHADLTAPLTRERIWLKQRRGKTPYDPVKNRAKMLLRRAKRQSDVSQTYVRELLASRVMCPLCGRRMTDRPGKRQKHIDHIIPIKQGGTNTIGNLRVICRTCNLTRRYDDLHLHQPTLWAADASAAEAAACLRLARRGAEDAADSAAAAELRRFKREGRREVRRLRSELARVMRSRGAHWEQIRLALGVASAGAAYNVAFANKSLSRD